MKTILIIGVLLLLWLIMRRRPATIAAMPSPAVSIGISTAGVAALGNLAGGIIKGYTAAPSQNPQPPAAAGISGSASAGLGDAAPLTDDDIESLLDLH